MFETWLALWLMGGNRLVLWSVLIAFILISFGLWLLIIEYIVWRVQRRVQRHVVREFEKSMLKVMKHHRKELRRQKRHEKIYREENLQ